MNIKNSKNNNKNNDVKIKFSERLIKLLNRMYDELDSYIAFELKWMASARADYDNIWNATYIDISNSEYSFDVTIGGKKTSVKIGVFLKSYFPDMWDSEDIAEFCRDLVKMHKGVKITQPNVTPIEHVPFKYQPKNVRSTFLSLVTKTYPMGHETEVLEFLPDLEVDKFGNYYKVISGDDTTMFTSHLDTADRQQKNTRLFSKKEGSDEFIFTDGSSILGADDKAGVTVMLYMMEHNIPGIYYFFIGEERGGIGSRDLASEYSTFDFLKNVKKCISFDRRKTGSVITSQYGRVCCSEQFGSALAKEYNKHGLSLSTDPTGVFTDSASLMDDIAECTNISVGYNHEHTAREIQNITYLEKLCKASIKVNWKELPIVRKVGINEEILRKYKGLIEDIKNYPFELSVKVVGFQDRVYIKADLEYEDVKSIYDEISVIQSIFYKHKHDPYVYFEDSYLKIQLK